MALYVCIRAKPLRFRLSKQIASLCSFVVRRHPAAPASRQRQNHLRDRIYITVLPGSSYGRFFFFFPALVSFEHLPLAKKLAILCSNCFYRQTGGNYPNKNRTKKRLNLRLFLPAFFNPDSLKNIGRTAKKFPAAYLQKLD